MGGHHQNMWALPFEPRCWPLPVAPLLLCRWPGGDPHQFNKHHPTAQSSLVLLGSHWSAQQPWGWPSSTPCSLHSLFSPTSRTILSKYLFGTQPSLSQHTLGGDTFVSSAQLRDGRDPLFISLSEHIHILFPVKCKEILPAGDCFGLLGWKPLSFSRFSFLL